MENDTHSSKSAGELISRQQLIRSTVALTALLGTTGCVSADSKAAEKRGASVAAPIFRFLQVNDLHIQHAGRSYKDANLRASWLFDALKAGKAFPKPDFILGIGDIVCGESIEGITKDFDYLRDTYLKDLSIPFHHIMGNHECKQNEGNPVFEAPFIQANGADRLNFSFVHKGIEFIAFNNSGTYCVPREQELARKKTLERLLQNNPPLPKIVCCHIPLIPLREKSMLAKSFGFLSYKTKDTTTLDVLQEPEYNVRAVLSGHLHITGMTIREGIHHLSIAGLASFPHDIAMYSVFSDRIDVDVIRIPSNLLMPTTNIHGAVRHNKDFTDNTHLSYTQYIMGNEDERRFSIRL